MMAKEYIKEIPNWEKQYLEMAKGELSKQQIKSHEGMIYGEMYNNWKRRKTNDKETV